MATFKFYPGIVLDQNTRNMEVFKLGKVGGTMPADADLNKAIKLDTAADAPPGSWVLTAQGEDIEAFVASMEKPEYDGQKLVTITRATSGVRQWVAGTNLAVGDLVVSGAQADWAKPNVEGGPFDKLDYKGLTVVEKGTPAVFKWRVLSKHKTAENVYLIEAL